MSTQTAHSVYPDCGCDGCIARYTTGLVETDDQSYSGKDKFPSAGIKNDTDKVRMELLSTTAMLETAKVLTFGAKKYADNNWRKGIAWSRVLGAALRHISAFNAGEDKDPESGLSHLAHASCCLMFLLEYEQTHKELDDRYKP